MVNSQMQPQMQFIDYKIIRSLYFNEDDIKMLDTVMRTDGTVSTGKMTNAGMHPDQARRIKYAYDIGTGKIEIITNDDLCKHMRRLSGSHYKVNIVDLEISKIDRIPRFSVVAGIKDKVYSKLNSTNYKGEDRLYKVSKVSQSKVHIRIDAKHRPVVPYKYNEKVKGIFDVVAKKDGIVIMSVDKKFCRLCNRYVVMASTRRPEKHLALATIIAFEGTKVYVYAQNIGTREKASYTSSNTRVYDYGYNKLQISGKLMSVVQNVCQSVRGIKVITEDGTEEFLLLNLNEKKDEFED